MPLKITALVLFFFKISLSYSSCYSKNCIIHTSVNKNGYNKYFYSFMVFKIIISL